MALINKEATKADIEKFNRPLCDGYHMKDYVLNQIINDIEDMPTVEAIPIEWVEKLVVRIKELSNDNPSYWNVCDVVDRQKVLETIEEMLKEWRRENAKEKTDSTEPLLKSSY